MLNIYNTYTREIQEFNPINHPFVGIYICGPTVYGHPHLGHVRGPVVFDVLHRYLTHLNFKVRLVRNITDVGHLVDDADEGEDKIIKKAKLESLEPMEIAQFYTNSYNDMLIALNIKPASIVPLASGHIIEQIEMIQQIIENGLAYEVNGSVYFDVIKYSSNHDYGKLSGRKIEELIAGAGNQARTLEGQDEKRNSNDFALWKKAGPEHIMQWNSPWSKGFPGWHIECSAMSKKYLGEQFDIHGGGMDLLFPHHESEIAQSTACSGKNPAKFWVHHNMITVNGQKMAKRLNNGIGVTEMFNGNHPLLEKPYSAMTLKFFVLMAHYRGTLDFSNEALQAAEKGLSRLFSTLKTFEKVKTSIESSKDIDGMIQQCYEALNDDLNTPILISKLFDITSFINSVMIENQKITEQDLNKLSKAFKLFLFEVLGLIEEKNSNSEQLSDLMNLIIELRKEAKANKNFELSDKIRKGLTDVGIEIKDTREGTEWQII